jgi:hypothetical protein
MAGYDVEALRAEFPALSLTEDGVPVALFGTWWDRSRARSSTLSSATRDLERERRRRLREAV